MLEIYCRIPYRRNFANSITEAYNHIILTLYSVHKISFQRYIIIHYINLHVSILVIFWEDLLRFSVWPDTARTSYCVGLQVIEIYTIYSSLRYKKALIISGLLILLCLGVKKFKFPMTDVIQSMSPSAPSSFCFMSFNALLFEDIIIIKPSLGETHHYHHWMPSLSDLMFMALNLFCLVLVHKP